MRETTMKRNQTFIGLAIGAAVALVGCSSNSPTAPKTPTPSTYGISLTVSPGVAGINETITAVALVTVGGANAPDGTKVTFTATGSAYFLLSTGSLAQQVVASTSGGSAAVSVISSVGGAGLITASVPNKSTSQAVHFTGASAAQASILSIMPNQAPAMTAGTTVVLHGQGLFEPQSVTFIVNGSNYPAQISSVAADGSSITVTTPQVPAPVGGNTESAIIQVVLGATSSTGQAISVTATNLFQFTTDNNTPLLYSVSPVTGSASGGEIVTLVGAHFVNLTGVTFSFTDPTGTSKSLPAQIASTQLGSGGANDTVKVVAPRASTATISQTIYVDLLLNNSITYPKAFAYVPDVTVPPTIYYISPVQGSVKGHETVTIYGANFVQPATVQIGSINETVQSVSSDGTTITVTTQPVSGTAPSGAQAVTVTTSLGVATLSAAFTYQESVNPTIYAISPNIGPLEGGTQVTITGIGFQYPVQVLFGTQQAAVISSNYNQVVCTSPSITASAPTTPTTVSVTVTNVGSGQPVSNGYPFQYGQAMFISSIAPGLGPDTGGTTVTITGQGFVSPVAVTFDGVAAQVLSVAGTQIVAKTSALLTRSCSPVSGVVSVTNTGSDTSATGPSWTYTPAKPLITSVVATGCAGAIQNTVPGGQAGCTLTVNGSGFESNMQLAFTNPTITLPENTGATSSTAAVFSLTSSFEGMGIKYNTTTCTNGTENLITAIDVKITDPANGCTNTLTGGLLVSPSNTNCQVTGPLTMTIAPSAASIAGGTTLPFAVNLSRPAQATDGTTMTITISPSANGVIASATSIPLTIAAGQQTATFNVTAGANAGTATITANYGGATATANLTVTTATTGIVFTPSSLNLTAGQGATIGISINPAAATSTNVAVTLIGPSGVIAAPAFPQTVVVPAGGTGSLTITAGSTSGTVTLQGAATGLTTGTATVTVTASAATLTITPANQTLVPGQSASLNVTISPPPSAPAAVNLYIAGPSGVLTSPTFPDAITVPTSGTLTVPITAGSSVGTVTINGAYGTNTATATVTVQTIPLTLTLAPGNQTLAVGGTANYIASINLAQSVPVNVYITQNGPTGIISFGGLTVGPPDYVTIPANQTFTSFTVNGLTVGGPVTVTGTLPPAYGSGTATSSVTVSNYILTLSPNPIGLGVGATTNMTVSLNNPVPTTTSVTLTSANPLIASVPTPVVFSAGSNTATAVVTGVAPGTTTITAGPVASLGNAQATTTVTVTPYTFTLAPNPMTLSPGGTATLTANLNNPAASGHTTQLVIGTPTGVATLGTYTLIFPPGTTTATTVVTAVGAGTATVTAQLQIDAATVSTSNWTVTTVTALTLSANPGSIAGWQGGIFNVQLTLNNPAPAAIVVPLTVTGPTNIITLSAPSVTFAAGATTAQFTITAISVSPNQVPNNVVATLPGTYGGGQTTVAITVNLPLTFAPNGITFTYGDTANVIVTMAAAQSSDTTVTLTLAGFPNTITFPATVTIPANTTFATFQVNAISILEVSDSIVGTLPPTLPQGLGGATASLSVTVTGPSAYVLSLAPNPFTVAPGSAANLTVSLSAPAPVTITVALTSGNNGIATVATPVTFSPGATTATALVTGVGAGTTTVTAKITSPPVLVGVQATATVQVVPYTITLSPDPLDISLLGGASQSLTVTLNQPASSGGAQVILTSLSPGVASVTSPVVFAGGATTATAVVTGNSLGTAQITGTSVGLGGATAASTVVVGP